ncbi:MAG: ATP-binding cassette domain-containing protein [Paracoccaceae bacterium]
MLDLQHVEFSIGSFALRAHWALKPGAHLAVIGPSGAGKSTLLAGIAGFTDQASGRCLWNAGILSDRPDKRPVAMLFQDHNLFPHLSVSQNVGLGLQPTTRLTQAEQNKIDAALQNVGLDGLGKRRPAQLSGGQQSRVALARVLVMARPIILLDEPFSALGPAQRAQMLNLVKSVANQLDALLIMVTHDPGEARALGGFACFVENGVAHPPVEAETFFNDPPQGMRDYIGL